MDTLTAIATRRSTRVYKPEQISDSQLQTVLAAGWASPVGHGAYDELYISVVQNPKILENFAEYCGQAFGNPKYNPFYGAPTLIRKASNLFQLWPWVIRPNRLKNVLLLTLNPSVSLPKLSNKVFCGIICRNPLQN